MGVVSQSNLVAALLSEAAARDDDAHETVPARGVEAMPAGLAAGIA